MESLLPTERLDIYTQFLTPAGISPRQHKPIETTDIMLLMVAHGRGGPAMLAGWLAEEYAPRFNLHPITLGREGIANQIFLGMREADADIDYVRAFVELAAAHQLDI